MTKRVRFRQWGKPVEVAEVIDVDLPRPGPDEVLVQVEAAPINPSDIVKFGGGYGYPPKRATLPIDCGAEGVGRVIETGGANSRFRAGQLVALSWVAGAWSERLVVKETSLVPVPDDVDPPQAAMVVNNAASAWLMLEDCVRLEPGDWVIHNAANSALGHYLVALASRRGVRTIGVVERGDVAEGLKRAGADVVLEAGADLPRRVAEATGGALLRVAFDAIAGAATMALAECLPAGAGIVNFGLLSGEPCQLPSAALIFHQIKLSGFTILGSLARRSADQNTAMYRQLLDLMASGVLRAPIDRTYRLDQLHVALAHAQSRRRAGKVLLVP